MPPEQEIELLKERVKLLENIIHSFMLSDRFIFTKDIQFLDARNIQTSTVGGYGLKIGTAATQRLGFFGATPVVQQGPITAPSGGSTIDSQARNAINDVITDLEDLGLFAAN